MNGEFVGHRLASQTVEELLALRRFAVQLEAALCQRLLFHRLIPVFRFIPVCLTYAKRNGGFLRRLPGWDGANFDGWSVHGQLAKMPFFA